MAQTTTTNSARKHDGDYYWDFVTFNVEDCIFRVPKYRFLDDSETFAKEHGLENANEIEDSGSDSDFSDVVVPAAGIPMFLGPSIPLGAADAHVEVSLDVTADEFRAFLRALYPKRTSAGGDLTRLSLSREEWLSVLKLSTRWFFKDLRNMAIESLNEISPECGATDPTESIILGRKYHVEQWLVAGYHDLLTRERVITVEDAEAIGWKDAIQLCALRESIRFPQSPGFLGSHGATHGQIATLFALEFASVRKLQERHMTEGQKSLRAADEARAQEEIETRVREAERQADDARREEELRESIEAERSRENQRQEEAAMREAELSLREVERQAEVARQQDLERASAEKAAALVRKKKRAELRRIKEEKEAARNAELETRLSSPQTQSPT